MFHGKLTPSIGFEIGTNKLISTDQIFHLGIDIRTHGDHRGLYTGVYFGHYGFEFNVYDIFHADKAMI